MAFKPNTDDLREAPAIEIAQKLIDRGVRVKAHDPIANARFQQEHGDMGVQVCDSATDVIDGCDAVVLVTEWNEYRDLDWEELTKRMRSPIVLDGRNALDADRMAKDGVKYLTIV